jgi:hypothetical protein
MGRRVDTRRKARSERGDKVSGERLGAVSQMSAHSGKWAENTVQRQKDLGLVERDV